MPIRSRRLEAALLAVVLLGGCGTTGGPLPVDEPLSWHLRAGALLNPPVAFGPVVAATPRGELGPIRSTWVEVDAFQGLLVRAGLSPALLPVDGRQLTPDQAARLLTGLLGTEVALREFGPWRMAAHLLMGVARGGGPVGREELHARMRRYVGTLVLRPDGYLVRATTGEAVQYAGEVELTGGTLRAEGFEVGPFYGTRGDRYLYRLEDDLGHHPDTRVAGVAMPDTGTVGPAVEGLGKAVVETVEGIAALVMEPGESLAGLARLPAAVRALIENSPEYWERYRALPHGEQVRQASRLLTHVLLVCGTAGAGGAKAAAMGGRLGQLGLPVLSLSGEGVLALRRVVVPAEQFVTAVGQGASAVYVLHMANMGAGGAGGRTKMPWPPVPAGPGRWIPKNEAMSARARKFQSDVTEAPAGWVYRVEKGEVWADFDGYKEGVLLDAKGLGYKRFFNKDLSPKWFFEGADDIVKRARTQLAVADDIPIQWHVAEETAAEAIRFLLQREKVRGIQIVHTPALP